MKKRLLTLVMSMVFMIVQVMAQQKTVTGRVTSADDGSPLPGVSVKVRGTSAGASTDVDGRFSIKVSSGQVLVFSFVGSVPQERTVGKDNVINVRLSSDSKTLNEVVVVGYGTQKKANLTGSVSTVDTKVLQARPITDVARGLQGAVPGLTITTPSGDLGKNPSIRLRGLRGSLNGSGAQPLILLDNVEIESLQLVNPDDIESISVLKDAASTSIYGTRAAWGVVLITTKSGKKGAPNKISYTNNFSWSNPISTPTIANAADGAEFALSALQRANPNVWQPGVVGMYIDTTAIRKMREWEQMYGNQELSDEMVMGRDFEVRGGKLFFYRPWDAGKMYMRDWTPQQNHNITVSGGSEKTTYNIGLGYLNQDGILKVNPDEFDRYNISTSINTTVSDFMDVRGKLVYSNTNLTAPFAFSSATYGPWYYLYRWPRFYPYGTYEGEPFRSAVTEVAQASMSANKTGFTRVQIGTTLRPFGGLTIDGDYTYSSTNGHYNTVGGGTHGWDFWSGWPQSPSTNYQSASYDYTLFSSNWSDVNTGKLYGTYVKDIGEHSFKAILGGDIEYYKYNSQSSRRNTLLDPEVGAIAGAIGDQNVGGGNTHWSTMGAFGRINYTFKDRYLLELNGRFDGSSRFPKNRLWGFFPSVSAGYIISEEEFMKPIQPVLSFFKIRGSYGSLGNQDVGSYAFIPTMSTSGSGWWIGNMNQVTISTPTVVQRSLTWETVTTLDFGIDTRFFKNELGITFDWYQRKTTDMLSAGVTLPSSFGATSPRRNYGEMETKGWELAIDYSHEFDNGFRINLSGSLSDFQDRITKYANTTQTVTGNYEGKKYGEIWGFETDRYFTEDDFDGKDANNKWILKPGIASQSKYETATFLYGPGDIKYKDLDGNGVINNGANTVDDHGDLKVIGNTTPRYQYGFRLGGSWKGIDFDAFFQGVGKRDFWASGPVFVPGWNPAEASFDYQMDYWTPERTNAYYPRPTNQGQSNNSLNFLTQSKYLLNMAYLRAKNISVGYTLPKHVTSKVKIDKLRFYVSGENLFTISSVGIPIDPEIDYTADQSDLASFGRVYPYRKTMSFGVQLTL
ncbi:SusC/RagA family TonB-linked outer membrane protein [Arcticibacter tournemirensis]|uniref:TonB-dependent receptor n=1 Tax=Arcticibacter tournemirensis TaxID=699437 RepID=A0A4Q0M728_9SPHI|nr:TonB-dependent receptor [Arcticibacter tournemirensis]RXF68805.1 TonB-dependent receptor [Arcticibacter tournemirensis]